MVLLSAPTLWSHVDFSQLKRSRVFLERACEAPIHVTLGGELDETTRGLLRDKVAQIVSVNCDVRTLKPDLAIYPMPFLRELNVTGNGDFSSLDIERQVGPFPSLTSLGVMQTIDGLYLRTPHLTNFRFRLHEPHRWRAEGGIDLLVDFFRNCPMLEVVHVDFPGIPPGRMEVHNSYAVHLPHLCSFTQVYKMDDTAYPTELLDQLSFPPTCSITLKLFIFGHEAADMRIHDLFPAAHFRETNFTDVRRVKIKVLPDPETKVPPNPFTETYRFGLIVELINAKGTKFSLDMIHMYDFLGESHGLPVSIRDMQPMLQEWVEEMGRYGSVETLCLEGHWNLGDFVTPGALSKINTLILSDVCIPTWFFLHPMRPGGVRTFVLHFRSIHPQDADPTWILMRLAKRQKMKGSPFEVVHLAYTDLGWFLPEEELGVITGCVGWLDICAGDNALDWNVDKHFLRGLEHCQWFRMVPRFM